LILHKVAARLCQSFGVFLTLKVILKSFQQKFEFNKA
jgi:hypothetical protein